MTRPCLCGLAGRPRRLFGFTAREAAGGAPSFRTVLSDLGGSGLPPTFTPATLLAGVSKIQGGRSPPPSKLPVHEIRRAPVQEAASVSVGPGEEPVEALPAEERPHRRPVHQERSEEHTSELQSPVHLVCRLLLEKKKNDSLLQLLKLPILGIVGIIGHSDALGTRF